jgi:predicted anti-sigma-YlaC factor YlaD
MKCEDWQELILERERLEPDEQRELVQHLSSCMGCRAWAKALTEMETILTAQLRAEVNLSVLSPRISRAVARERRRRWMTGVPELLEALGWSALGGLAMAGLLLWSGWRDWIGAHLWLADAVTLAGSLAWAGWVLWKDQSEARRFL